jgi:hypothetical protein
MSALRIVDALDERLPVVDSVERDVVAFEVPGEALFPARYG